MMLSGQVSKNERREQPLVLLPYAAGLMSVTEVTWRESPDGWIRLIIPGPPLWRRLIGPAISLIYFTLLAAALVLATIASVLGPVMMSEDLTFTTFMLMVIFSVLAVAAIRGWIHGLRKIIRLARYGTCPFVLRIGGRKFEIVSNAEDGIAGSWSGAEIREVRFDQMSWSVLTRLVRFEATFRSGDAVVTYIRWPDRTPLLPVETRVRAELERDAAISPSPPA
jgi:hypothetical protein